MYMPFTGNFPDLRGARMLSREQLYRPVSLMKDKPISSDVMW